MKIYPYHGRDSNSKHKNTPNKISKTIKWKKTEDQVEQIKDTIIEVLKKHGVKRAALFGSVVRGEATKESDVDLLVEFEEGKSLLDLAGLKIEIEKLLKEGGCSYL